MTMAFLGVQCSDKNDSPATLTTPDFDIAAFSGECLNLQTMSAHINAVTFNFPAIKYVRNYKINSYVTLEKERSLYSRALEFKQTNPQRLPEFDQALQINCESIQLPIAGGIVANYKITEFDSRRLKLEFVPFTEPMIPSRPQGKKFVEAFLKFPVPTTFDISAPSARELVVTSTSTLAPSACQMEDAKVEITATEVYIWEPSLATLPTTARIELQLIAKLNTLFPPSFADNIAAPPARETQLEISTADIQNFNSTAYLGEASCTL